LRLLEERTGCERGSEQPVREREKRVRTACPADCALRPLMKKVMCFGTFDKLHKGHLSYLKQAKKYGDYMVVVVARDKNVVKIKSKPPREDEKVRLRKLKESRLADKAILGQLRNKFKVIEKYRPNVICLGYDQRVDKGKLKKVFKGKIIRLKAYREDIYKSSKLVN